MREIEKKLAGLKPIDVCSILKRKFVVERMERFFDIDDNYSFSIGNLNLNSQNSILIKFRGITSKSTYNLLLIFSLQKEQEYSHQTQNDIRRISEDNIDKIVIWCLDAIDNSIVQALKVAKTSMIYIPIKEIQKVDYISNFFPYGKDYNYAVILNKLTDLLLIRLKKLFHFVLSEIAAPTYDTEYGKNKIGTQETMDFEKIIVNDLIKRMRNENNANKEKLLAVDVGCGTGRHSIETLSPYFDHVYGFDFSDKMIKEAQYKKRANNIKNVSFSVADMEYEEIIHQQEYSGKTDLVVSSFGMASFIEDTPTMLRKFHSWLKPGAKVVLSFYNRNSILLNLQPNWRDTSLSAHLDVDSNTLQVELTKDTIFQIYCKPFDNVVKDEITKIFDIEKILSFPTTLALLPNDLLKNEIAKNLFRELDKYISTSKEHFLGHYVIVVAKKKYNAKTDGYLDVINILNTNKMSYDLIPHSPVYTVDDVLKQLGDLNGDKIKTIILKNIKNNCYYVVAFPFHKRLEINIFSKLLNEKSQHIKLAVEKQISELGFELGGIPPFGYKTDLVEVKFFVDIELTKSNSEYSFMGVGKNTETLKLKTKDFLQLINNYTIITI